MVPHLLDRWRYEHAVSVHVCDVAPAAVEDTRSGVTQEKDVVTLAAEEQVRPAAAVKLVVAVTAVEAVVAAAADEGVITGCTHQRVVTAVSGDAVFADATDQAFTGRSSIDVHGLPFLPKARLLTPPAAASR